MTCPNRPKNISFLPILPKVPKILILGSMPGMKSLEAQQYYAHPQNAFWKIMSKMTDVPHDADYQVRIDGLCQHHIALWDVVYTCDRPGSLDSNIVTHSIIPNDFADLFQAYLSIHFVALNGAKAFELFERFVVKTGLLPKHISYQRLPSTSPAHAMLSRQAKQKIWIDTLTPHLN